MKKHGLYWLVSGMIVIAGCQKELSFEGSRTLAEGSLQSEASGDCLPKVVNGVYEAAKPLVADTNTIEVTVDVTRTGSYTVYTDTVNGYFFRGMGLFTSTGLNTVKLRSTGTPFVAKTDNFKVYFDSTECDIAVNVLPAGASSSPAVFALVNGGTPANCASAAVNGTYVKDAATGASHFVRVTVNVTTIGTYTIKATGGGMTFQKTGVFAATGNQAIDLPASGTPTTTGANTITFDAPFNACSFTVQVEAGAAFTVDCSGANETGTYTQGTALAAGNTVVLPVTVTSAGAYSISTSAGGMTFAASGILTLATTSITLNGSGTPNAGGTQTFTVNYGSGNCSFTIDVTAAPPPSDLKWKFTEGGITYEGPTTGATEATAMGFATVAIAGTSTAPNTDYAFLLNLAKTGSITTGAYTSSSATTPAVFTIINTTTTQTVYSGIFGNGANLTVNLTTFNTVSKVVEGNFSGTVKDAANATKTITAGTFKAMLP